jgi:hypothetical protein
MGAIGEHLECKFLSAQYPSHCLSIKKFCALWNFESYQLQEIGIIGIQFTQI